MGVAKRDPFLLGVDEIPQNGKPKVKEKVTVTEETETESDPFMLGVKKKETSDIGGEGLETGTEVIAQSTSPSGSEVKETITKRRSIFDAPQPIELEKSFLDRDIELQSGFLSNPKFNEPVDKNSLQNLYRTEAQGRYDDKVELAKTDIKSSPEKLASYTQKRVSEINDRLSTKKAEAKEIIDNIIRTGTGGTDDNYEILRGEIEDAEKFKSNLKNSIAAEAARKFIPEALASGKPFNPRDIGRTIIKVADPEQEQIFIEAEKGGTSLPGITKANVERLGLDLTKQYILSQPKTPESEARLKEIEGYENDFAERNVEATAQVVKEKLGNYFYENGKSGFWGYSGQDIESAINNPDTGLTPAEKKVALEYVLPTEKKLVFSTDIPGSGFFRSAKNAIDKSLVNTGNTLSGWIGSRNESDRALDILNSEVEQSRFRAPGENPTWKSELAYLTNKEAKTELNEQEKKQKVELEKFVDVRNGWSKFKDGVGDLTGQVVEIALLSKGVGASGRLLTGLGAEGGLLSGMTTSAMGTALSNETVGLFLSSYLNSYDSYRTQALQMMPGTENAANRDGYAKVMASVEGLSEKIFNDTKVLKGFTKEIAPSIADITNRFINKEITQQVARQELQGTLEKYLKPFGKEFAKSTLQESSEEAVVDIADAMSQSIFGGQPFDAVKAGQQAVNTFLTTALYSPLVAGAAAHGATRQNRAQNSFVKSAIVDMAKQPGAYLKSVEDLKLSNIITQEEANEKIKIINSSAKYLKEIPESITVATTKKANADTKKVDDRWKQNIVAISERTDIDEAEKERLKQEEDSRHAKEVDVLQQPSITSKQLDYPEVSSYLVHRLNEGILKEKIDNLQDEALRPSLEQELKRSIEIRKGIINSKVGITPDLQEVTDDEKMAADLGILNANELSPDELIGTPFEVSEEGIATAGKIQTPDEIENNLTTQLGEEKSKEVVRTVNEFSENDLLPAELPENEKAEAKTRPLGFLKAVAEQAQTPLEFDGKTIDTRERAVEKYGEDVVKLAEETFPKNKINENDVAGKSVNNEMPLSKNSLLKKLKEIGAPKPLIDNIGAESKILGYKNIDLGKWLTTSGLYFAGSNDIRINPIIFLDPTVDKKNRTIIHEAVHLATYDTVKKYLEDDYSNIRYKAIEALDYINKSFVESKQNFAGIKNPYGFSDLHEFITEFISNPSFRSTVARNLNGDKNILTKILDAVKDFFSIVTGINVKSDLNIDELTKINNEIESVYKRREENKDKKENIDKEAVAEAEVAPIKESGEGALKDGFKEAGEKARDTKDATHIGRWMLDNSQKGDVVRFQDGGYEVTEVNTRKDGTKELVLTPFEFNADGTKDYNNTGIKLISEQSIKNGSNLFENAYTNSKGERVVEQSTYEVAPIQESGSGVSSMGVGDEGRKPIDDGKFVRYNPDDVLPLLADYKPTNTIAVEDYVNKTIPNDASVEAYKTVPIESIKTSEKIENKDRKEIDKIKEAIKNGDDIPPIVVDFSPVIKNGEQYQFGLMDGHHRYIAYKELGIKEIPAAIVTSREHYTFETNDTDVKTLFRKSLSAEQPIEASTKPTEQVKTPTKKSVGIFDEITKADKSKISKKEKTSAIGKVAEKYGEQGKKAALIHSNFDSIVKQLKENKKLEVICK